MRKPKETHGRTVHSATDGTTVRLIPNATSETETETEKLHETTALARFNLPWLHPPSVGQVTPSLLHFHLSSRSKGAVSNRPTRTHVAHEFVERDSSFAREIITRGTRLL